MKMTGDLSKNGRRLTIMSENQPTNVSMVVSDAKLSGTDDRTLSLQKDELDLSEDQMSFREYKSFPGTLKDL
jgi:hypothetical protein